jgi:hypothetical protein
MAGPSGESCERCRFWERAESFPLSEAAARAREAARRSATVPEGDWLEMFRQGSCRRLPPQLLVWPGSGDGHDPLCDARWPHTQPDDWCGEFVPREGGADAGGR